MKLLILCLFCALAAGQRITTIQLDGVQYFVSRMNPYSPELNYFLAYQYCRSLGLQLASFETKEKVESMSQYLQNAGYSKYDFWTSGNRLGTGMFLWMSTGLPFNATFDYFENSNDAVKAGLLDPVDHNSNTSPQRTARDSNSGLEKGCVMLQAPSLKWAPEDCSAVKDFICEQTRCYYYNYGSIPVSSAQGRPLTSTTPSPPFHSIISSSSSSSSSSQSSSSLAFSPTTARPVTAVTYTTTPIPVLLSGKSISDLKVPAASAPAAVLRVTMETSASSESQNEDEPTNHSDEPISEEPSNQLNDIDELEAANHESESQAPIYVDDRNGNDEEIYDQSAVQTESEEAGAESVEETTSVEHRLRKISEEIEKYSNSDSEIQGRQSFFSLADLIKNLQPGQDKKIAPQIDSDYSNTMHLGEKASIVAGDDARKIKTIDLRQTNRALY